MTAAPDDPLGRLAIRVKFPVLKWVFVWGVEDRLFEESIFHIQSFSG